MTNMETDHERDWTDRHPKLFTLLLWTVVTVGYIIVCLTLAHADPIPLSKRQIVPPILPPPWVECRRMVNSPDGVAVEHHYEAKYPPLGEPTPATVVEKQVVLPFACPYQPSVQLTSPTPASATPTPEGGATL